MGERRSRHGTRRRLGLRGGLSRTASDDRRAALTISMSTTHTQPRQPKGASVAGRSSGGEFSTKVRSLPSGDLLVARTPLAQKFDTLEEKIEAMSAEVEVLVEELKTDAGWNRYLETMSKFHSYSFTNQLLIALQLPDATRVAGNGTWKALGRTVKPFEERGHGASIFRPVIAWVDKLDNNGEKVLGQDGKPLRERRPVGYSATTVYDVAQTAGEDLPVGTPELTQEAPPGFREDLERSIADLGFTVSYEEISRSAKGFTSQDGRVVIDSRLNDGERAMVLAHELGHIAAGHLETEGDYHVGPGGQRGRMEIEAESISHVLLRMNGMDPSAQSGRYAAGWAMAQRDDPEVVKKSAAAVQVAVKRLIGERLWANVPGSGPQERPVRKSTPKGRKK